MITGCTRPEPAAVQALAPATATAAAPTPTPARATVEVTRIVLSERVVEATPAPPQACAPRFLDDATEIVVALLAPISEPASLSTALGVQTALSISLDALNRDGGIGGKPVRLWVGDTAGNVERAARLAEESITSGCASALIASSNNGAARAILEVAHRYGIPFFVVDASDDDLTATGYPEVFRLAPTNSMLMQVPTAWLDAVGDYNGDGTRSAMMITDESDAGATHAEWMRSELAKVGFTTDTYTVMLPSQDFSSLVARLVVRPVMPDVIFIRIGGDAATVLQRQLVENGIGPQKQSLIVAARSALQDEEFWSALGSGGLYTVVGRVGPWMSTVNEMGAGFATDYVRYLNRWPEAASFAAHDALCLLADAMERAPTLASSDLIAALEKSDMELTSGRITFPFGSQAAPESGGKPAWAWHQWMKPTQLFLQYTEVEQPAAQMAVIWSSDAAIVDGAVVRPNGE
jgi:branched-chain amino acid transport system substrate-binding protein